MPLSDQIIAVTVGIRYSKSFRIPDISGEIIDHILYNEESPFGKEFFPKVQETSSREKTLFNPDADEYLRLNTDDLILGLSINNNFEKKFNWLVNDVMKYLQNILFHKFKINNIKRLGIIYAHKIDKDKRLNDLVSTLTNGSITGSEKVSISFSRKSITNEGLIRKNVSDYQNSIYNFVEMESATLAQLDYQYYYEPMIEDLRDCFVEKILNESNSFMQNNYYSWLSTYGKED